MPLDPEKKELIIARGGPLWVPTAKEALAEEAAITSEPQERYGSALMDAAGTGYNPRAFEALLNSGIFSRIDDYRRGGAPQPVRFTDDGAAYVLERVSERVETLQAVQEALQPIVKG